MLDTQKIYDHYHIPPNLQEHQRLVASVANAILSSSRTPIRDPSIIIQACLYHDMGNIIKFNFSKMPELFEPGKIAYWQGIQTDFIEKYGTNVHDATLKICKEIGLPDQVIQAIDQAEWINAPQLIAANNIAAAIVVYSDMRVGPFGIMSAHERIENLATRSTINVPKFKTYADALESFLQPLTTTNLHNIS